MAANAMIHCIMRRGIDMILRKLFLKCLIEQSLYQCSRKRV